MKTSAKQAVLTLPTERELQSLVHLLVDEDPDVYATIRRRLLSYGFAICSKLQSYALSSDPTLRRRVREILDSLSRQANDERFLTFCQHSGEDLDLELGTSLLAQTAYPQVNPEGYLALYDDWAGELKTRLNLTSDPESLLREFNRYFFEELRFSGNDHYSILPECSYLNCVVDQRSGNPISLSTIYLFLTRRLCLPVTGIGLPGHFICRFQNSTCEIYLDIFRQGRFLTRADCIRFLVDTCHGVNQGFLAPVGPRRILSRMCANLHQTYSQLEMAEEAARMQRYLIALAR